MKNVKFIFTVLLFNSIILISSCCKFCDKCKDCPPVNCDRPKPCCTERPSKKPVDKTPIPKVIPCDYCGQNEQHEIDFDRAAYLIKNFHSTFRDSIANAGGEFHFSGEKINKENYQAAKFFFIFNSLTKIARVAYELGDCTQDDSGEYHTIPGMVSKNLVSHDYKDTIGRIPDYSSVDRVKDNLSDYTNSDVSTYKTFPKATVVYPEWQQFDDRFHSEYNCESIYFNYNNSLGQILDEYASGLRYYFGYDPTNTYHKLRLILVGVDGETGKNVIFNEIFESRLRESSRPRP